MLRITGYSDKYSVCPGDDIKFYINSEENEVYEAQLVRLIHGDTNPEGPGYKEEEISASCNKSYPGRNQKIHGGGYVIIPQDERLNVQSFTLQCYIFPTSPDKGRQGIVTKWAEGSRSGFSRRLTSDRARAHARRDRRDRPTRCCRRRPASPPEHLPRRPDPADRRSCCP